MWLSLWNASGSVGLALADGLGAHPARRLLVGLALVSLCAVSLWQCSAVCAWLQHRPLLVVGVAAVELGVVALDGLLGTPYVSFTLTAVGVAVVVARARTVWLCVALLEVGYVVVVLANRSPSGLASHGELGGVIGAAVSYPFTALVLLSLRRLFSGFVGNAAATVEEIRRGDAPFTPALASAILNPGSIDDALPGAPGLSELLTPSEVTVVNGLAGGSAPKEIAYQLGVSVATVRTHIKHAKRKTGARTLRELAGIAAQHSLPGNGDHSG